MGHDGVPGFGRAAASASAELTQQEVVEELPGKVTKAADLAPSSAPSSPDATLIRERPLSKIEAARARAPKPDDCHPHEPKRTLKLGGVEWSVCRCGLCRRGEGEWKTVAAYTRGYLSLEDEDEH